MTTYLATMAVGMDVDMAVDIAVIMAIIRQGIVHPRIADTEMTMERGQWLQVLFNAPHAEP